jgi:predicted Rossmann fold nucleotide-binding protein DprA/Smf involved in DNA uptake
MPTLNKLSSKRRKLRYAELLRMMASAAPDDDLKREVERLAGSVERRYGFSDDEKRQFVIDAVLDGARTVVDLVTETGFRPQDVDRLVKELQVQGRVKIDRISIHGTGRPSRMIIPIEAKITKLR